MHTIVIEAASRETPVGIVVMPIIWMDVDKRHNFIQVHHMVGMPQAGLPPLVNTLCLN